MRKNLRISPRYVVLTRGQLQWYRVDAHGARPKELLGEVYLLKGERAHNDAKRLTRVEGRTAEDAGTASLKIDPAVESADMEMMGGVPRSREGSPGGGDPMDMTE